MTFTAAISPQVVSAQSSLLDEYEIDPSRGIKGPDVIHWQLANAQVISDKVIEATYYLTTEGGFALYDHKLKFLPVLGYTVKRGINPLKVQVVDPITGQPTQVYKSGEFRVFYESESVIEKTENPKFDVQVKYIACTEKVCLFPFTEELSAPLIFAKNESFSEKIEVMDVEVQDSQPLETADPDDSASGIDLDSRLANVFKSSGASWWLLVGIVFLGGLLTNLTPCVFPMIPITMRVLSGQTKNPFAASSAYAFGILLTYSALGIFAASTGTLFGSLMASKSFNVVFALIMFVFGITMLGFGNFSKLQVIGNKFGNSQNGSLKNAMMMGVGAGLVASPCTGPILAALLAFITERNDFVRGSMLMVTYSFGFALPYVFLGSLSGNLTKLKVPGGVQIGIKVFFAAIMFALGFYYLRIPLYGLLQALKDSWGMLLIVSAIVGALSYIVVISIASLHTNKKFQLIPVIFLGLMFFSAINYNYNSAKTASHTDFTWNKDAGEGQRLAIQNKKLIIIDNWAEWCEACKKMDITTFTNKDVIKELQLNWVGIKKDLTEADDAADIHMEKYGIASLPTLILLPTDGSVEQVYKIEGYVNGPSLLSHMRKFKESLQP